MRSLTFKLTLAFLWVGLTGAILVAVLVGQRTRTEFDRFRSEVDRDRAGLVSVLADYYAAHNGWAGLGAFIAGNPQWGAASRGMAVIDASDVVVLDNRQFRLGQTVPPSAMRDSTPIVVDGQTVGFALFDGGGPRPPGPGGPGPGGPSAEVAFLNRVGWAAMVSAAIAALIALILGILLAQSLTRPLRELTAATRVMAGGRFDQRVSVRSRDEIGELAASFNHMAADLERASQARKQITADLAHDLRTPLSILRGYTEGLQEGRIQGDPWLYGIMHSEVTHLQRLVEDLRILSLADAGELSLNRRVVDPRALLERTGLAYIMQAEQQGLALRIEAPQDLPSICVDTDRLTQVLNNLVSNALRHTRQGEIVLAAERHGAHVDLTVSDTGSGIEAKDLPFIFDRFYRVDESRHRGEEASSGLGLAIAKAIVEAHGGSIMVNSTPGRGTTFTITLPVVQDRPERGPGGTGEDRAAGVGVPEGRLHAHL